MNRRRKRRIDEITLNRKKRIQRKNNFVNNEITEVIETDDISMKTLKVTEKTKTKADIIAVIIFAIVIMYILIKR